MSYATQLLLVLTSLRSAGDEVQQLVRNVLDEHRKRLEEIALTFVLNEVTPTAAYDLERKLEVELREVGRQMLECMFNMLEPEAAEDAPHDVMHEAGGYRRLNKKTRNKEVSTLFGKIELYRFPYRYWHRDSKEPAVFPLELELGFVHGATPALAEAASRYLAEAGATQQSVLDRLKCQHGVAWGAQRLRDVTADVSQAMDRCRQEFQVLRVLELLEKARRSKGSRKPVLSVGRDGVTLRDYRWRYFEHATAATVTVYDRSGNRLGTVYLAYAPQLGQAQMTTQLTALIRGILARWEGPLPKLCYVTDAGENETQYYRRVLCNMRHPRTGQRLKWRRIVDYYHAAQRISRMAEALFGKDSAYGRAWAYRMRRLLKKPNGPSRVLHSAAAMRARKGRLSKARSDEFRKAYRYIQRRTHYMQYHDYKKQHLPIGSGVTEAACKTIFAQRLKLSGMRWTKSGAQVILNLRVVLLSGIWQPLYRQVLESHNETPPRVYGTPSQPVLQMAA